MRKYAKFGRYLLILGILVVSLHNTAVGQEPLRIMPLGNSLTVGETGDPNELPDDQLVGYRFGLKYLLQQGGYNVDFVGSQSNGSAFFSDCQHAGIGGSRDQYVERLLIDGYDERYGVQILDPPRPYLDEFNPDIILLHIGTNDITHEADPVAVQRVSAILDLIDQYEARAGKTVTVFLALIIKRRDNAQGSYTTEFIWNPYIKSMAESRIASGDNIVIVDMEKDAGIDYSTPTDDFTVADPQGIHLNSSGYNKMAALWYSSIINNYNSAPTISPIPDQSIVEGGAFNTISLDNYVDDQEDPDEDITWTYSYVSTSNLSVSINSSRVATIVPVDPYWSGSESVIFTATDNGINGTFQLSDSDTVQFTVTDTNDPPVITDQEVLSVIEEGSITLSLADFTVFDPDQGQSPDNQVLTVFSGDNYTVSGKTVTPVQDFDTELYVNVAVSDEVEQGPVYSALVTVLPVNDPPVLYGQSEISFNEDHTYELSLNELSYADVDNTNSELSIVMKSGNNHTCNGDLITPDPNYFGTLYIETYLMDSQGAKSNTLNLEVQVNPVNDVPEFVSQPLDSATAGAPYIYPFNAVDADGDPITYSVVDKPAWLLLYINSKLLAGTPVSADVGYSFVDIEASDGIAAAVQTFYIHVLNGTTGDDPTVAEPIVKVYPNPVVDYFTIDCSGENARSELEIYNSLGRLIFRHSLSVNEQIHLSADYLNMEPGIYLYNLTTEHERYSGKFIVGND